MEAGARTEVDIAVGNAKTTRKMPISKDSEDSKHLLLRFRHRTDKEHRSTRNTERQSIGGWIKTSEVD